MSRTRSFLIFALIYLSGGLAYCALELMYRGRTHISMFFAGGLCILLLYFISVRSSAPAWKKWIIGGAVITTIEFITGAVVNIVLDLRVWDYSAVSMNLMGQICLYFFLVWILLSIPAIWLLRLIDNRFINREKRGA